MDRFPEEIWMMIFEDVANTILGECKSTDNDGECGFGEAIKQYLPLLLVCQKFKSLWMHVRVAGKLFRTELLDLAEHACFILLTTYPQECDLKVQTVKKTCGRIWRTKRLERLLPTYFDTRGLANEDFCYLLNYYAPVYLKLETNKEGTMSGRRRITDSVKESRLQTKTPPMVRGQKFTWVHLSPHRPERLETPWVEFTVGRFRLGPYKIQGQYSRSTWTGVSVTHFRSWDEDHEVSDTEENEFKHGRLWLWYERNESTGYIVTYRFADCKLGTVRDPERVLEYPDGIKVALLENPQGGS